MMGYLTDLTDEQWAWVEPVFPPQEGPGRRRTVNLGRVLNALMYQDRTGCQWRLIPLDFPPSGTVRYYFDSWNEDGTMLEIHDRLRRAVRTQQVQQPLACVVVGGMLLSPICSLLVIPVLARIVMPASAENAVALPPAAEPA